MAVIKMTALAGLCVAAGLFMDIFGTGHSNTTEESQTCRLDAIFFILLALGFLLTGLLY